MLWAWCLLILLGLFKTDCAWLSPLAARRAGRRTQPGRLAADDAVRLPELSDSDFGLLQLVFGLAKLEACPLHILAVTDTIDNYAQTDDSLFASTAEFLCKSRRSQLLVELLRVDRPAYIETASFLNIPRLELPNLQDVPVREAPAADTPPAAAPGEDELVPNCVLDDLKMGENLLEAVLLKVTRDIYADNTEGIIVRRTEDPGITGLIDEMRQFMLSPVGRPAEKQQQARAWPSPATSLPPPLSLRPSPSASSSAPPLSPPPHPTPPHLSPPPPQFHPSPPPPLRSGPSSDAPRADDAGATALLPHLHVLHRALARARRPCLARRRRTAARQRAALQRILLAHTRHAAGPAALRPAADVTRVAVRLRLPGGPGKGQPTLRRRAGGARRGEVQVPAGVQLQGHLPQLVQAPRAGALRQPRPAAARVAQLRDAGVPVELRRDCAPAGRRPDVAQGLHRRLLHTRADEGADTARRRREAPSDSVLLCVVVDYNVFFITVEVPPEKSVAVARSLSLRPRSLYIRSHACVCHDARCTTLDREIPSSEASRARGR